LVAQPQEQLALVVIFEVAIDVAQAETKRRERFGKQRRAS